MTVVDAPGGARGRDLDGTRELVAGTVWHNTRLINGHFPGCATPFWLRDTDTDGEPVFERPRLITEADATPIDLGHHKCSVWRHDLDGGVAPDLIRGSEDSKTCAWLRSHLRWDCRLRLRRHISSIHTAPAPEDPLRPSTGVRLRAVQAPNQHLRVRTKALTVSATL